MTKRDLWKSLFWPTGPEWFHCGGEGMATGAGRWKLTSFTQSLGREDGVGAGQGCVLTEPTPAGTVLQQACSP